METKQKKRGIGALNRIVQNGILRLCAVSKAEREIRFGHDPQTNINPAIGVAPISVVLIAGDGAMIDVKILDALLKDRTNEPRPGVVLKSCQSSV